MKFIWNKLKSLFSPITRRLAGWYEGRPEREKQILQMGSLGLLGFLVVGSVVWTVWGMVSYHSQIAVAEEQIEQIRDLEERYQRAKAKQMREEKKFRSNMVGLFSFLQSTATRFGLTLSDLNEQKTNLEEQKLVQTSVVVNLKEITIDRLTAFLEALEETHPSGVVKVTKLRIKTRYDAKDLLDAQMTVSTWKSM